uniref:BTB domain-containing protein n=1 Tax=Panagrolaimus sp. ES5 TaxID=591445 RepID=A0AC34G585_9BILA
MQSSNELIHTIEKGWKFKKADLLALKDSKNGFLDGKRLYAFDIPGLQYFVRIYPNGLEEDTRGQTWIGFTANGLKERKVASELTISIESANFTTEFNHVYKKSSGNAFGFCETAEFFDSKNNFFINGEITIKINGILKAERFMVAKISRFISMIWKIKKEDLQAKKDEKNGCLRSERIDVSSFSDIKYYLKIYPNKLRNGKQSMKKVYLNTEMEKEIEAVFDFSVYLNIEMEKEKEIEAVFDFSVNTAHFDNGFPCIFKRSQGIGTTLCSPEDLFDPSKGYIVDGFLILDFNGILSIEKEKEFLIIVGDKVIEVNKQVLMDYSAVFTAMFEFRMKETIENKMIIPDFPFEIVDAAINLCYGATVPRKFGIDDICITLLSKCSKESTPVYGAESLDKDLLASLFLNTLRSVCGPDSDV